MFEHEELCELLCECPVEQSSVSFMIGISWDILLGHFGTIAKVRGRAFICFLHDDFRVIDCKSFIRQRHKFFTTV
jgi:hypothetical protein